MSPLPLRRFRAERLLRKEFEGRRARVLSAVGARLRGAGLETDEAGLEDAYALAWHGLYTAVLEGEEIENPVAWLVLVTFRRAVDQRRAAGPAGAALEELALKGSGPHTPGPADGERLAERLDDRVRLEQLLEGLTRLDERERTAATLCYLHGLSRAQAGARMGLGDGAMRRLMDGRGDGEPGVAAKIGELARTIEEGGWCETQGSLMRALAYGILDREGQRYRLAVSHQRRCPSCRAYVASLRGLGAAMPPLALPGAGHLLGAGGLGVAERVRSAATELSLRLGGGRGAALQRLAGLSGAGGGAAAAGGPLAGKFAVGCLMALGIGAGCIGLAHEDAPVAHRQSARAFERAGAGPRDAPRAVRASALAPARAMTPAKAGGGPATVPSAVAVREFGPEQALPAVTARAPASPGRHAPAAARPAAGAPRASAASLGSPGTRAAAQEFAP